MSTKVPKYKICDYSDTENAAFWSEHDRKNCSAGALSQEWNSCCKGCLPGPSVFVKARKVRDCGSGKGRRAA